jgi:hypothetical protein
MSLKFSCPIETPNNPVHAVIAVFRGSQNIGAIVGAAPNFEAIDANGEFIDIFQSRSSAIAAIWKVHKHDWAGLITGRARDHG